MKKAFTLVEILVTIAILSLVVAGIFMVLNAGNQTFYTDLGVLDLQQGARHAMDTMTREIRQARPEDIDITNGTAEVQFIIPTDITTTPITYSTLIIYRLNNNQIIREHPQGVTQVMANDISNLSFCCLGGADCTDCDPAHVLRIQLRATKTVRQRVLAFPVTGFLTEEVRLRN